MMVAKNDITGDSIMTKTVSSTYRDNYDAIFRKPSPNKYEVTNVPEQETAGDSEEVTMSELRESRRDCVCSPLQPE